MPNHPLQRFPDTTLLLPPAYFGGVGRYALIAAHAGAAIDRTAPFDKRRKRLHRCTIADTRGLLTLTVPVAKPGRFHGTLWTDILVSDHGNWPRLHLTALESAYGRTPFFEFYIDRIAPLLLEAPGRPVVDLDTDLENLVLAILGLPPLAAASPAAVIPADPEPPATEPYWQLRAPQLGFIPSLSILDLIFSLGPEAPLHLRRLISPQ